MSKSSLDSYFGKVVNDIKTLQNRGADVGVIFNETHVLDLLAQLQEVRNLGHLQDVEVKKLDNQIGRLEELAPGVVEERERCNRQIAEKMESLFRER